MTDGSALDEEPLWTERLALEPLVPAHAREFFEALQTPSLYAYWPGEPPESLSWLEARYGRLALRRSPDGSQTWLNWAVRERATGALAGTLQSTVLGDGTALLAYTFVAVQQGRGFAAEGARRVVERLRDAYGVRELFADIDTRNARSIRLVEKLGFTLLKETRDADFFKGAFSHEYRYRLALQAGASTTTE
jgi:RimJ/RimL family protein N-acetyltransferase